MSRHCREPVTTASEVHESGPLKPCLPQTPQGNTGAKLPYVGISPSAQEAKLSAAELKLGLKHIQRNKLTFRIQKVKADTWPARAEQNWKKVEQETEARLAMK